MDNRLPTEDEMINAHLQGPTLDGDDDIGADDTCEDAEEEQVEVDQEALQLVLQKRVIIGIVFLKTAYVKTASKPCQHKYHCIQCVPL
jgi:U3 small nucleolar RNA-associated protein 14